MPNLKELIDVFEEARRFVALPDNDFAWSSWIDTEQALAEIDGILDRLRSGSLPRGMSILFAPTGPMQELSLSSGWDDPFMALASRFDAALADASSCECFESPPTDLATEGELGFDESYGEASVLRCRRCGRVWLRYSYEIESISRSGRWYLGAITNEQRETLTAANAKRTLESLDWYYCGGSYFGGETGRTSGVILL